MDVLYQLGRIEYDVRGARTVRKVSALRAAKGLTPTSVTAGAKSFKELLRSGSLAMRLEKRFRRK